MAKITLETDGIIVDVEHGARLMDVLDAENGVSVMFGCRNAGCGICLINVKAGFENLSPVSPDEKQLLDVMAEQEHDRLCCQVRVFGDAVIAVAG